jgi:hypothetical protein
LVWGYVQYKDGPLPKYSRRGKYNQNFQKSAGPNEI